MQVLSIREGEYHQLTLKIVLAFCGVPNMSRLLSVECNAHQWTAYDISSLVDVSLNTSNKDCGIKLSV